MGHVGEGREEMEQKKIVCECVCTCVRVYVCRWEKGEERGGLLDEMGAEWGRCPRGLGGLSSVFSTPSRPGHQRFQASVELGLLVSGHVHDPDPQALSPPHHGVNEVARAVWSLWASDWCEPRHLVSVPALPLTPSAGKAGAEEHPSPKPGVL